MLAGAVSVTLSLPDLYRASATVIVQKQQVSEAFVTSSVTAELETRLETIRQQVMSRARLTDLICRLDLYPELRATWPADALVERMRRDAKLELAGVDQAVGRGPTIAFTVSYSGRNPQTVADVANTLVAAYVDENAKSRTQQATRTSEVLRTQLADARKELDARQQQGNEFKSRHTGELPEQLRRQSRGAGPARHRASPQRRVSDSRDRAPGTARASTGRGPRARPTAPAAVTGRPIRS